MTRRTVTAGCADARRSAARPHSPLAGAWAVALAVTACGASGDREADAGADAEGRADPEVHVAVATNFASLHRLLAERFTASTGIAVRSSSGSSGQLFAQIVNGAPFDVFLSADTARPARLERDGLAVPGSRFMYAGGRLALYGPGLAAGGLDVTVLREAAERPEGAVRRIAIANPDLAPYGHAARQALGALGVWSALRERIVIAENVGQAFQFVESGAAELGWVSASYVYDRPPAAYWLPPSELHDPIRQEAVLLAASRDPGAARSYLDFLRGEEARAAIEAHGYVAPEPESSPEPEPSREPSAPAALDTDRSGNR